MSPVLPGGLVEQASLPAGGTGSIFTAALDQIATASNLFVATTTDTVGVVNAYDITSVPAGPRGQARNRYANAGGAGDGRHDSLRGNRFFTVDRGRK